VNPTAFGAVQELATLGATDHRLFPLGSRTHGAETTCAPWQGAADAACCNPEPRRLSCFLLRSTSARVQVPEEPDPEPCLRLAPSEKLQAPCLRHTPPTAVPPSTPCITTCSPSSPRTMTFPPILSIVRRTIFPRTYTLGLRPAQRRTTPRPRRLRTRTSRAESIGLRWLLALATELRFGGSGVRTPQLRRRWTVPPLPKASETARTCSLASVKLVTDQRNERRYAAYYDTALPPFLSPLQIAPLAAPFPPSPPTPGVTPQQGSLDGGKGRSKGGHSAPSAEAALYGSRPSGATPRERAGSACGLRHRASTVPSRTRGKCMPCVSGLQRIFDPLALSPPEAVGGAVRFACSPCRARTSQQNEGRGRNPLSPLQNTRA